MSEIDLGIEGLAEIETIGRGGSAAVYRARQIALDRVVAVKVLMSAWDVDVRRRFDRECRSMGKLSDDIGVVPIYESGETSTGAPYIVMPYYPAGSLQDEMNRNGAFDWREASSHIKAVAETIAAANESGVVHRDIKPANLLLGNDGKPRVSDFGIARQIADDQLANHASTPLFTPAYSAPESFSSNTAVPTIDVYGLGSTFWALLAGHAPFKSKGEQVDMITVFSRVANDPVGDLREVAPDSICSLVERTMAKTPAERPRDAYEFLEELDGAIALAEQDPVSVASLATVGSATLIESTISLSQPVDSQPAATIGTVKTSPKEVAPLHPPRRQRVPPRADVAPVIVRRPAVARPVPRRRSGLASVLDREFWHENSSKLLIAFVALLVLATLITVLALPNRDDQSSVAGARETQVPQGDPDGPQIIGLSTTEVSEESITIEFSTDVCSLASFDGVGLDAASTEGWPNDFSECSAQHSHTFTGLELGNVYTVTIEVVGEGVGRSSDSIEFTAGYAAIEGAPLVVDITRSSATVEFTTTTCTVVQFTGEGLEEFAEEGWPDANDGCSEDHAHTFTGLKPATNYKVEVNILDLEGRRTRIPVEFLTPDTSFAISQFAVNSVSSSEATVSFVTSQCSHARFFGSAGSHLEKGWNDASADCSSRHSHTYTALKPGMSYTVEVEARQGSDRSETVKSTRALSFTTEPMGSVPVAEATVIAATADTVTLSVTSDLCTVARVEVRDRVVSSGDWDKPTSANCKESHTLVISELESGESYTASVKTKSVDGQQSSPASIVLEPAAAPSVSDTSSSVTDQSVSITFTAASCDTYSVQLDPAEGSTPQTGPCPSSGSTTVTFNNLATGTYDANITVISGAEEATGSSMFEITSIDG